ncbi:MAG TPA: EAL domain-containing protein, partial [Frankiaceae bacterium]|nr:EAL domain-containing protein [Frankiaceae bacterium]
DTPSPAYAVGQVEDITEQRLADAALRVREERFRRAFDNARTGMMFLSVDGSLRRANRAMSLLVGYPEQELLSRDVQSLCSQQDSADLRAGVGALVTGEITIYQAEHCLQHADGHQIWGLMSGSVVHDATGQPDFLVFQVEDVTARREAESQLAHRALHDDLTGLPNRALLADHLQTACARAERSGSLVAVLFLDLDDFKEVNDSLGHVAGDQILIEVATRLRGCMRETDTAARRGGDEFVVVCEDLRNPDEARRVADRIDRALATPMTAGATQVQVTVSIGIATTDGSADPEDLLRGADTAMYRAKINGKARYEIYDPSMHVDALRQLTLAGQLSKALIREELRLQYQPVYDLHTGVIVAVEALLRWQHPTRGLLPPGEFLDVAEGRRLMIPLGNWVLAAATAQASKWQQAFGTAAPDVWINIAGQQLGKQHFAGIVQQALTDTGLPPGKLGLEVTERQFVGRADAVRDDLLELRGLGVRLAVDDFGTGFASLDYLRRFSFNEIKIDQSFICGLGRDRTDTAVTASIIALGHSLDLVVVAEGVETPEQRQRLQDMGCDQAQGYLLQRPAPPATIDLLINQDSRLS